MKHSREPDSVPAHRLFSNVPQPPPSRPSHDAIRALKPPLPINAETVSKQVLSKQAHYQPIRVDDLIAKAGTLTWVKKLLQVRLCKSPIPLLSDPSMSFSLFRRFAIFDLSNLWWRAGWWHVILLVWWIQVLLFFLGNCKRGRHLQCIFKGFNKDWFMKQGEARPDCWKARFVCVRMRSIFQTYVSIFCHLEIRVFLHFQLRFWGIVGRLQTGRPNGQ